MSDMTMLLILGPNLGTGEGGISTSTVVHYFA